jgi:hypothetical protein
VQRTFNATVEGCRAASIIDFLPLPELLEQFGKLGCDVVEMVLASQDSWDRYEAAQWLNVRRWLDDNPDDELAGEMRAELTAGPARYARYQRIPRLGCLRTHEPLSQPGSANSAVSPPAASLNDLDKPP